MIRLLILFIAFSCSAAMAQQPRYFIDNRETVPQSFTYLQPGSIDSIKMLNKQQAVLRLGINDSAVVAVMKKGSKIWSLKEVMENYYIEPAAFDLPIRISTHHGLPNMKDFLVSPDMIGGVGINMLPDSGYSIFVSVNIPHYTVKPEVQIPLRLIKKQYAMMP